MSNPNQEIIESRLATYVDGELDPQERIEIEQHLQQNPQYRRLIEELRKQRDMLRGLPREAAPLDLAEAFTNQLERAELLDARRNEPPRLRIFALQRIAAAAAIVLLTLGLGAIVYYVLPGKNAGNLVAMKPANNTTLPSPLDAENEGAPEGLTTPAQQGQTPPAANTDANSGGVEVAKKAPAAAPASPEPLDLKQLAKADELDALREKKVAVLQDRGAPPADLSPAAVAPREVDLDQLARKVSNDPQIKQLLLPLGGERGAGQQSSMAADNARVLVVCATDPAKLEGALSQFLRKDNVDWHPAPRQVELALNTTLAAQNEETRQAGEAANKRKIDGKSVEMAGAMPSAAKRELLDQRRALAAEPPPTAPAAPPFAFAPKSEVKQEVADGLSTTPASAGEAPSKGSAAKAEANPAPSRPATMAKGAAERAERQTAVPESLVRLQGQAMTANDAPVEHMYVVRRLNRRQADALHAWLAGNGEVHTADASRSAEPTPVFAGRGELANSPATAGPAAKPGAGGGHAAPQASDKTALGSPPEDRTQGAVTGRDFGAAQNPPPPQGNSTAKAPTLTTRPAIVGGQPVVPGAQSALADSQFRNNRSPEQAPLHDAAEKENTRGNALAEAGRPVPSDRLRPAADADETVDVVIVVQRDSTARDTIAAPPPTAPAIPSTPIAASPSPAASIAPAAAPAPAAPSRAAPPAAAPAATAPSTRPATLRK